MSYINEALKKAQELKDSGNSEYFSIPERSGLRRRQFGKNALLFSISILLAIAVLFSIHLWTGASKEQNTHATVNNSQLPVKPEAGVSAKKELYDKALSLYKAGRTIEAKKLYEAVVGLDPGYVEALNNLSIIYIHDRDFDMAKINLEKAIRLNPAYVETYYNLACLYAIKGDINHGIEYLEKAISLDKSVREWAGNDSDLQNLRRSSEFNKIISH
jgi:tetratricopeptide (TPR) repeat protein